MRNIMIFDTTLRDGEQSPGCSMKIADKVKIAKMLDEAQVDVIEAGFAASNDRDFQAIKEISKIANYSIITSLARCNKKDIDIAYEAIREAKKKRIHVFIATSDIHMKYKLNMNREKVVKTVSEMVKYAKEKCDDIEFSLEDATRTDKDFACLIIDTAISAGATTINIPDTVGYTTPDEFTEFLYYIRKNSNISKVNMSIHCHNDLGLATANSMTAIKCMANQVECCVNGIGERAGNTALEEVVAILDVHGNKFQAKTKIDTTKIYGLSQAVQEATGSIVQNNKPIVGKNAFLHEAGIHQAGVLKNKSTYEILNPQKYGIYKENIVLGIHSGKNAILDKMEKMNLSIDYYDIPSIVEDMKDFFEEKQEINDEEFLNIVSRHKNKNYTKTKIG